MCLAFFQLGGPGPYSLVLVANRDEALERPTAPLHWWNEPEILAGQDLEAGGTWLGVGRDGAVAFVTNYRDPTRYLGGKASRGDLPVAFLRSRLSPEDFARDLAERVAEYNPFNFLAFRGEAGVYLSSRLGAWKAIEPGVHGISNADLDTPWPKVARHIDRFVHIVQAGAGEEQLLALMQSRETFPDTELPDTGIGLERERLVAPAFIRAPGYGTRSTTLVFVERAGRVRVIEVCYSPEGEPAGRTEETFVMRSPEPLPTISRASAHP